MILVPLLASTEVRNGYSDYWDYMCMFMTINDTLTLVSAAVVRGLDKFNIETLLILQYILRRCARTLRHRLRGIIMAAMKSLRLA